MKLPNTTVKTNLTTPLGTMILASADGLLVGAWFEDQAHLPELSSYPSVPKNDVLKLAVAQLSEYFAGRRSSFTLPLNYHSGTVFQHAVWQALQTIPFGISRSYSEVAQQIGKPKALRAVGAAVGRNPLSIINPCHRVIGTHGSLTGYAGGLKRKTALLQLEGVI